MEKVYSKINKNQLLHFIHRSSDFGNRRDLIDPHEVLQLSSMKSKAGTVYKAHRHIQKTVNIEKITAQEAWVVISGIVRVTYFDLDDSKIGDYDLQIGDVSVSIAGGHSYEILEDSNILEFKTGPYLGQLFDKVFIKKIVD